MPVTLTRQADQVDITSAEYDALLRNLQANILWAHGRNFARHVFLKFTGDKAAVRGWIRTSAAPLVTTSKQQLDQIITRETNRSFDGGMVAGFFLSALGYRYLGFDTGKFEGVFRHGMKSQKINPLQGVLGSSNKDPELARWEVGFRGEIHALMTVADTREDVVKRAVDAIRASLAGVADVLTVEEGIVLRRINETTKTSEPIEHFGYFDGISNPLFTRRDLAKEPPENEPHDRWNPGAPLELVLADDPLTAEAEAYGSYLVYRKLGQNVAAFEPRVKALAAALSMNEDLAGAMVVGRFKDGTPVVHSAAASVGPEVLNNFDFREDEDGLKCPFHAHIRKVNPRGGAPGSLEAERTRRIVRRGIPYGKEVKDDPDPAAPRGLLFMCFQRDINHQFEFIQRSWVDNVIFPRGILFQKDTGDDPLIGQDPGEPQQWPKAWGKDGKKSFNFESAVTLKGGEYFFAPSIPFLRSL